MGMAFSILHLFLTGGGLESYLKVKYPVYTLDNQLILPENTELSPQTIDALVAKSPENPQKKANLLEYGTIRRDMFRYIMETPSYHLIFSNPTRVDRLIALMGKVHLPVRALEFLDYFKEKDYNTYRHILMVFAISTILAQSLITDYNDLLQEVVAGPIHDFGKIAIPVHILKKYTPLNFHELEQLKHHTIAGYVLLCHYFRDKEKLAAIVARDHHERRNGSGYPRGIRLQDQMVEIVVVSDIFDALISPRPYRPTSYDNRTALEEITWMAVQGEVSWNVVKALVALNRKDQPHFARCRVSTEKRGEPPKDNLYGLLAEDMVELKKCKT